MLSSAEKILISLIKVFSGIIAVTKAFMIITLNNRNLFTKMTLHLHSELILIEKLLYADRSVTFYELLFPASHCKPPTNPVMNTGTINVAIRSSPRESVSHCLNSIFEDISLFVT